MPIPPGLVVSPEACIKYAQNNRTHLSQVQEEVREKLEILEKSLGQKFGQGHNPLLVSLRPGAEVQMPGIIKDICNIGLNDSSVLGLALKSQNEQFAWNTYRQFVEDFSIAAMNIHPNRLQAAKDKILKTKGLKNVRELPIEDVKQLIQDYFKIINRYTGRKFPQNPDEQLWLTMDSIYNAWKSPRAVGYRRMNDLTHIKGTGVTIQKMVFSTLNNNSGAGIAFTRNPLTGEKGLFGDFMMKSQLDDLMSGKITPKRLVELKLTLPNIYEELETLSKRLEARFQDVQNIHFAIENGALHLLYSKNAKLAAEAEVKSAVDLVNEKILTQRESISLVYAPLLQYLPHNHVDQSGKTAPKLIGKGIQGSTASATGKILFNKDKVAELTKKGNNIILFSKECSTEDYVALTLVKGYVTQFGSATADSSILIRERSIASVLSCEGLEINEERTECRIGNHILKEGDTITINGDTGEIYEGEVPLIDAPVIPECEQLLSWADNFKKMKVMMNANNPQEVALGKAYGAEGIGLCKSERMYLEPSKLNKLRKAIITDSIDERKRYLEELVQVQKEDYKKIFRLMSGKPCVIRILDPPLNSFVPGDEKSQKELAAVLEIPVEKIAQQHANLAQYNPSLGLRGSRLAVVYPEFIQFEVKSIFIAALEAVEEGLTPLPCIELPMISSAKEFTNVKKVITEIAEETGAQDKIKYQVGALIEIPRAALTTNELAKVADFLQFGSNDLTQMTCGFSHEDSQLIIDKYVENGIYFKDPFVSLDECGVGYLMKISINQAKQAKKNISIGISGSHAYDPASIKLCQKIGVTELSCLSNRVPMAKIAAAQAALAAEQSS